LGKRNPDDGIRVFAGEEAPEFLNSLAGFVGGFAPPYSPAVILLPLTLVVLYLLHTKAYDTE
jgi:hypothetical protein